MAEKVTLLATRDWRTYLSVLGPMLFMKTFATVVFLTPPRRDIYLPDQDCTAPPSLYVGETSRSIQERGQKHWGAARRKEDTSHMRRHQILEHGGEEPRFLFQVVNYHTTALARQIKEAVCIRRRGGAARTLNS